MTTETATETTAHRPSVVGFSRVNEAWAETWKAEHLAPGTLMSLDEARAQSEAAQAAGAHETGWFADCAVVHGVGCGWRGEDRETEDAARADARAHDPGAYDASEADKVAKLAEREARAAERARVAGAAAEWMVKLDAAQAEVERLHAAYAADLTDAATGKAYRAARKTFRSLETAAINDGHGTFEPCHRCGGSGGWKGWPGFTCYECGGRGRMFYEYRKAHLSTDPKVAAKKAAAAAEKLREQDEAFAAGLAALPSDVAAALSAAYDRFMELNGYDGLTREEGFRYQLYEKLRKYGSLSEAQVGAVQKGLDREQAREAKMSAAGPLPEGRYEVEGVVVFDKWTEDTGYGSQHKMKVELDDGNAVWGTVPAGLYNGDQDLRGSRVKLTATVERSRDDEHFGFYKRPAKAEFLTTEEDAA